MPEQIAIKLTGDQWNYIAAVLGERPLKESLPIFSEIKRQFAALEAAAPSPAVEKAPLAIEKPRE